MTPTLRAASLLAATIATGLLAGTFALYAHTIMPGLRRTDDRTFVAAFRAVDRAILNPWFLGGCFVGAPALTLLAGVLQLGRPPLGWIAAALVLDLVAAVITVAVHLPLNDALKAAGDDADPAAVRARFGEARWARWNGVRAVTSVLAVGCLAWAALVEGAVTG